MEPQAVSLAGLAVGVTLDLVLGDPPNWPHPVRAIGWLIRRVEGVVRAMAGPRPTAERVGGCVLALVVVTATAGAAFGLVQLAGRSGLWLSVPLEGLLVYWGLAARGLGVEALRASEAPDLGDARRALARIVGRDTEDLDRGEVCRACVETVAENANDAVVAPLFFFAVGGVVGLWAYKAVNTLDSMVGYRDDRYRHLGWASARLDDLLNLAPARLTWLLIALAAACVGERPWRALTIGWRDGRNHPSPNAGWGEAAMAGALGVQLGGPATYGGVPGEKPRLGDPLQPIGPQTVRRAARVLWVASAFATLLAGLGRLATAARP